MRERLRLGAVTRQLHPLHAHAVLGQVVTQPAHLQRAAAEAVYQQAGHRRIDGTKGKRRTIQIRLRRQRPPPKSQRLKTGFISD